MHTPLNGMRVLDLGRGHAGPYCAKLFADAGADVIHVERPDVGDPTRAAGPFAPQDVDLEFSASFAFLNAGKRSITLDYRTEGGAGLLRDLVRSADVLVENSRPGTLERHGFGMSELQRLNPALVVISITNYGQTGPYLDRPASELTLQAAAGLMDGNGDLGRPPLRYPMNIAQHWAGSNGAYGGLVAYWHALMTGQGQQVDVSIQESLATSWFMVWADYQYTGSLQARGRTDMLPAADGQVMLRWQTSVPWDVYAIAMDAMELVTEPDLHPFSASFKAEKLEEALARHMPARTRREWMDVAIEHELPAGMLQSLDDVANCEHLRARHFWNRMCTPWGADVAFPGTSYTVHGQARGGEYVAAPRRGQHNGEVYCELLGRTRDELRQLRMEGAIRCRFHSRASGSWTTGSSRLAPSPPACWLTLARR